MPLLTAWWNMRNCALVHLPYTTYSGLDLFGCRTLFSRVTKRTLFQTRIVEPSIIVVPVLSELVFVLDAPLAEDGGLQR